MQKISLNKEIYEKVLKDEKKCTGCKKCMDACPMLEMYCDSPKNLLKQLIDEKEFDHKMPYACMLCNYCTEVCPEEVNLNDLFLDLRSNVVSRNKGKIPKDLGANSIEMHQLFSFSSIFSSDIESLDGDTIFFPGCDLMSYSPDIVEKTFKYLKSKIPGLGIYIKCCGNPTLTMGNKEKFMDYYEELNQEFKDKNVKRIITGCEKCLNTIGKYSEGIEVVSLWEVLGEVGIPEEKMGYYVNFNNGFLIHDPCSSRKIGKMHNSIRKILDDLGIKFYEVERNKNNSICCGSGGMVNVVQNEVAKKQISKIQKEYVIDKIITYSQNCAEAIRDGGKESYHLLDLIFKNGFVEVEQTKKPTFEKWRNRFKVKVKMDMSNK